MTRYRSKIESSIERKRKMSGGEGRITLPPSVQVLAGAIFRMDNTVSDDVINVIGVTTGDKFVCKWK